MWFVLESQVKSGDSQAFCFEIQDKKYEIFEKMLTKEVYGSLRLKHQSEIWIVVDFFVTDYDNCPFLDQNSPKQGVQD